MKKQTDLLFKIEQNTLLIDIATCNVAHLLPDDSVGDAAGIMANMQISSVVVTDLDGHPLGIVTERDMLQAMRSVCPPETALRKIMSAPVITLPESITCLQAYQICRRNSIRHLVIVNHDQQVVGVVSETDFRMHINLSALAGHRQVGAVMRQAEFCLPPDASVADALNLMQTHSETCVLITDAGRPIGIITERDIVKLYSSKLDIIDMPVIDVMTTSVLTIPLNSSINNAAELMLTAKLRHLIVVDQSNRTVGLISEHDLTENLLSRQIDEKLVTDSAFLHILINTLPDMVWLKDANGVYLACNQRFEGFFGAKQADIVGKTDYDFVEEEQANLFRAHDVKAMENNSLSINEEWVTFADDGHQELLETTKTVMHDNQGKLIGVLGIAHDITKRKKNEQLLRLSEEKYRSLVQNIPDVVWTADQTGKIIFISDNATNIFGYLPKEIYAEPNLWFSIIHADDVGSVKTQFFDLFKSNQILDIEFRIKRKDGEWVWIRDRSFVTYTDGGIRFADGLFTDITQSKKAKTALAESEDRYRALFENSPFCIHEINMQGQLLSMNQSGLDMLGLDGKTQIAGTACLSLVSDMDKSRIDALLQAAINGIPSHFEFCSAGKIRRQFKSCFIPIRATSGKVVRLMGITEDISDRKQREWMLALLSFALNRVKESVFVLDENGRFLYVNDEVCRGLGYNRQELLSGMSVTDIDPYWTDEKWAKHWPILKTSGSLIFEASHQTKDGRIFPIGVNANYFEYDGQGYDMALVRDITEQKKSEALLLKQKQFSDDVINNLPGIFYMLSLQGGFVRVNPEFLRVSGYSNDELHNQSALIFFKDADRKLIESSIRKVFETGEAWAEAEFITKSGEKIPYFFSGHRTMIDDEPYLVGLGIDNTDRKRAEENLRIIASVFDNSQEAILITDANNLIIDVNQAFTNITGYSREEVLGKNPKFLSSGRQDKFFYANMWQVLKQDKIWRGEIWNRRKSGEVYAELLSISVIYDNTGKVRQHVAVFSDISHLKAHEAELSRVAYHDALTGIPNRLLLTDRLSQAIMRAQRNQKILAICYLDLDGFKQVNDQYGHEIGDKLLVKVTRRLTEVLRVDDTLARLGGDEFVLLFNDLAREQECLVVLDRILHIIAKPVYLGHHQVSVSASIGVTFYQLGNEDGDTLLRYADQAMYIAKQMGRNRYHLYDSVRDQRLEALHEARRRILLGLENDEFELFYQPKIVLASGAVSGAEALIRWHHPERGILPPTEFLPLIADSDLEIRVGEWVMEAALSQLEAWRKQGLALEVSINISARHLQTLSFAEDLRLKLAKYPQLSPWSLQIEVLETAALADIGQSSETIESCRKLGVNFALDDFGTGYSSLVYLRKLLVDTLKIDQTFVRNMMTDEEDRVIVQGIIALANAFGRKTVAEGVEVAELIPELTKIGCMYGQGYGIAYPMPAMAFFEWCKEKTIIGPATKEL